MAKKKTAGARPAQRSTIAALRTNFLTGLVVVAPIVITIYLTWTIITFVDAQVVPLVPEPLRVDIGLPGFGVVIFLVFTTTVGYFTKNIFGRQLIKIGESWVDRMPIVRSIYNALKQIVETILSQSNATFQNACLVEYPRRGIWAIAFVSTETKGEIMDKVGGDGMMSVFLPTTPNPTSGFLLFVPKEDVILLDMTVEEAAKLVISAGLVTPPTKEEREASVRAMRRNGNGKNGGNGTPRRAKVPE